MSVADTLGGSQVAVGLARIRGVKVAAGVIVIAGVVGGEVCPTDASVISKKARGFPEGDFGKRMMVQAGTQNASRRMQSFLTMFSSLDS